MYRVIGTTPRLASLGLPDAGMNVVFLRRGMEMLPEDQRDERAFQVRDPNGVIIELLDWKAAAG